MSEEAHIGWKEENIEQVLARLERLYDAEFNVFNQIHYQSMLAG